MVEGGEGNIIGEGSASVSRGERSKTEIGAVKDALEGQGTSADERHLKLPKLGRGRGGGVGDQRGKAEQFHTYNSTSTFKRYTLR